MRNTEVFQFPVIANHEVFTVAGSQVVTEATLADLIGEEGGNIYPPTGIPVSTGDGWGASLDPTTTFLRLSGGSMTGILLLSTDPTLPLHAATKQYVDALEATVSALEARVVTLEAAVAALSAGE